MTTVTKPKTDHVGPYRVQTKQSLVLKPGDGNEMVSGKYWTVTIVDEDEDFGSVAFQTREEAEEHHGELVKILRKKQRLLARQIHKMITRLTQEWRKKLNSPGLIIKWRREWKNWSELSEEQQHAYLAEAAPFLRLVIADAQAQETYEQVMDIEPAPELESDDEDETAPVQAAEEGAESELESEDTGEAPDTQNDDEEAESNE